MPNRETAFEDCTYEDLVAMHDAVGLSRGLIVQSFQHGHSYEYMLNALCRDSQRWRGVACPAPDITDRELEILSSAGVVGARFAAHISRQPDSRLTRRLAEFGWQTHYVVSGERAILAWRDEILASPGRLVLDHMANPPVKKGINSPEFRFLLECLDTGRCWTKLSPRYSDEDNLPFADTLPFIRLLIERYPTRLLWGSDWPHLNYFKPMINDGQLIDLAADWMPDENTRKQIFVDNPAELFGFPKPPQR